MGGIDLGFETASREIEVGELGQRSSYMKENVWNYLTGLSLSLTKQHGADSLLTSSTVKMLARKPQLDGSHMGLHN